MSDSTPDPACIADYVTALRASTDANLAPVDALVPLGTLIDRSEDLCRMDGLHAARAWGERLLIEELSPTVFATLHYFMANAWAVEQRLTRSGWDLAAWEQPEIERQIVHLRSALQVGMDGGLPAERLTQVLTNLGNLMSECGRAVEAIAYWDEALAVDRAHGMARGNRGLGLERLALLSHDTGHQVYLLRAAHRDLSAALSSPLELNAGPAFVAARERMESLAPPGFFNVAPKAHAWPPDQSPEEHAYRKWCLTERLFLNDLNEIGCDPIAAADVLSLPDMVTPVDAGPDPFGFFNQLMQEYVSARYLLYAGIHATEPHFSDRDVVLVNTLDYPAYGLATEQVRLAFRMAYSLLDKVAFFLNYYFALGISPTQVSFKKVWYERRKPYGLRPELRDRQSMPLLGLFWLAKDLYEEDPQFTTALEPDARDIEDTRQHLEHKYLKLHTPEWSGVTTAQSLVEAGRVDTLARSLYREDIQATTLRVLRMARAALMYLSAAVYVEEGARSKARGEKLVLPVTLTTYEDDWKT